MCIRDSFYVDPITLNRDYWHALAIRLPTWPFSGLSFGLNLLEDLDALEKAITESVKN